MNSRALYMGYPQIEKRPHMCRCSPLKMNANYKKYYALFILVSWLQSVVELSLI